MDAIVEAARVIAAARWELAHLQRLPANTAPLDETQGYRIQHALHALLAPEVGPLVGYKIGCTSPVMQRYLGIPHPCAGGVFAKGVHASGVRLRNADYVRVGVECEIAVRLGRDLAMASEFTADNVADAIDAYHPAIEIVDDRYADWRSIGAPTLIADDFFAAGCVLGDAVPRAAAPDLLDVTGVAWVNGVETGRGTGADVLGHPHAALAWLANHLGAMGTQLHAGQIVLTGSLVQTVWLKAGDRAVMELLGLGTVVAEFT